MTQTAPRPSGTLQQVIAILLLPLLLASFGTWEIVRGTATVAALQQESEHAASQLGRVQALVRRNPRAMVQFQGEEQSYAAPLAEQMIADGAARIRTDLIVAEVRTPFAWLTAIAGLASVAGGLLALALAASAARRSMRSRAALVQAFGQVRRLVPFALGCQVAGVAVALLGGVVFECGGLWFLGTVSSGEVKLVALALVAAGAALWGAVLSIRQLRRAFGLFQPSPSGLLGLPVNEAEAPGLFALVRELAHEQEAIMPETVVVGAVSGFFVTSYPQALPAPGPVVRGRTLHIPLPHLAVLSRAETRVVLAHELAHFSGEDTAYSVYFQPVYAGLQHSVAAVAGRGRGRGYPVVDRMLRPAAALGGYVLDRFDLAVKHWSRLREFEADKDALASELPAMAGDAPDALATSLLRTAITGEIVAAQLHAIAEHPEQAPADFVQQTLDIAARQGFLEPARHLNERQPHPTDTHPPTVQRIEAAGVGVDDGLLARAARPVDPAQLAEAAAMFADWPGLCQAVSIQVRDTAVQRERAYLREVAAAAAAVNDAPVALYERRVYMLVTLACVAVFCLALAGVIAWLLMSAGSAPAPGSASDDDGFPILYTSVAILLLGGVAACFGIVRFARNRDPFLVLDAAGFRSPGFDGTVPWNAVARVAVTAGRGVTTVVTLSPDHPLPTRTGRIWRLRTRKKANSLVFSGLTPRGMKAQAYLDLLLRYRRAAQARAELARREAG